MHSGFLTTNQYYSKNESIEKKKDFQRAKMSPREVQALLLGSTNPFSGLEGVCGCVVLLSSAIAALAIRLVKTISATLLDFNVLPTRLHERL